MLSQEEFFNLIQDGEMDQIKASLDEDPSLAQARTEDDVSAVLMAMYTGQPGIAQLLVLYGAELDIFEAAALGRVDRARELLREQPDLVNEIAPDGFQPLGLACFFGHVELAHLLVEYGAAVDSPSQNTMRVMPLHSAVAGGSYEITRLLVEKGAPVNARQSDDFTPLHAAAQNGDLEIVRLLLETGADPGLKDAEGKTALDFALAGGHEEVAAVLRL